MGVYGDSLETVITSLIESDHLNEERFARSYARGKFLIKQWGRNRIKQNLKVKRVSDYCIRKAMTEIEEGAYLTALSEVVQKELRRLGISRKSYNQYELRSKLYQKATRMGYESHLINEELSGLKD